MMLILFIKYPWSCTDSVLSAGYMLLLLLVVCAAAVFCLAAKYC